MISVIGSTFKFPGSVGVVVTLPREKGQGEPGLAWPGRGVWIESVVYAEAVDGLVFSKAVDGSVFSKAVDGFGEMSVSDNRLPCTYIVCVQLVLVL